MSLVNPATPFVVNWTRQLNDRLTKFCSGGIEEFATREEALEAAGRPFGAYVVNCFVREFFVVDGELTGKAVELASRKRGKKLVLKRARR